MFEWILEIWASIKELGAEHNVDPVLFAVLYFGTIPPYMGSMVWAVKNHKRGKGVALPVISTLFFFISPALYVAIFGTDVAWWVYLVIAIIVIYGSYSIMNKLRSKIHENDA